MALDVDTDVVAMLREAEGALHSGGNKALEAMLKGEPGPAPAPATAVAHVAPAAGMVDDVPGDDPEGPPDQPTQTATPSETAAVAEPAAPAAAPAPVAASQPAAAQPVPDGVLTKDGKQVIPYEVLQQTRDQANQAKAQAAEVQAQLEAANRQLAELTARMNAGRSPDQQSEPFNPDDFPKPLVDQLQAMNQQIAELKQAKEQSDAEATRLRLRAAAQEAQPHIDANPYLRQWQAKGGAVWQEAAKVDNALKADPAWQAKPLAERFAEVARRVCDTYCIPYAPQGNPAPTPTPTPQPAPAAQAGPTSISDIPGGTPMPQTHAASVEQVTPAQLLVQASNMSDAQLEAWLRQH